MLARPLRMACLASSSNGPRRAPSVHQSWRGFSLRCRAIGSDRTPARNSHSCTTGCYPTRGDARLFVQDNRDAAGHSGTGAQRHAGALCYVGVAPWCGTEPYAYEPSNSGDGVCVDAAPRGCDLLRAFGGSPGRGRRHAYSEWCLMSLQCGLGVSHKRRRRSGHIEHSRKN